MKRETDTPQYDEPYAGQGYPGGTSAANALVALIYGLKKTNFKRGAEASVKGDHVRRVDGATDKSVKCRRRRSIDLRVLAKDLGA